MNDTFSETQTTEFLPEIHFDKGEGRYEVNLPWKQNCFPKSTGYGMCVNRFRQLHSRLKKNTLVEEYNKVIQQQINSGIIESELVEYTKTLPATKSSVLKASAKSFDPVGILSPFTVNLKILFQLRCCDRVDWDEKLDENSLACWNSLLQGLESINSI
ncbi:Hypothetical predicted protein [Paramuricea clavata]|uniref:Uncharacterized protein n=1 Tax=Paramuricea clavata TaxID=317549 RepID=A0A6S7KN52_PARCT|nr:Hypothetical predicted protein [Paramuricea clavata]